MIKNSTASTLVYGEKKLAQFATQARQKITGQVSHEKLMEYVDKAALAPRLIDGTAYDSEKATALGDIWALENNITDIKTIGEMWLAKATALRTLRNRINVLESQSIKEMHRKKKPETVLAFVKHAIAAGEKELTATLAQLNS